MKHRVFDLNQVVFWDGLQAENEFKVTCEPLRHGFLDFTQVAFWAGIVEENEFRVPGEHLKKRFLDLTKVEFWTCQETENVQFDLLNRRFIDFIQIAILDGQGAENEFAVPCKHEKMALLTSPKSHFGLVQRPKIGW